MYVWAPGIVQLLFIDQLRGKKLEAWTRDERVVMERRASSERRDDENSPAAPRRGCNVIIMRGRLREPLWAALSGLFLDAILQLWLVPRALV